MPFLPPNQQHQSTEGNNTEGNGTEGINNDNYYAQLTASFSRTTQVSRYRKGKTSLDLLEQEIVSSIDNNNDKQRPNVQNILQFSCNNARITINFFVLLHLQNCQIFWENPNYLTVFLSNL